MSYLKKIFKLIIFLSTFACTAQEPKNRAHCQNPNFDKKVASMIGFTVPTINPSDAKKMTNVVFLDAREKAEFDVSHLPNARFIGYNNFEASALKQIPKETPIVVYCSIGYRSEKIGEKLLKLGYINVHNLYGSIFEWVNQGNEVVDNQGVTTKKVHTYNKKWSKWLDDGKGEKVW
jgi:rhodanese-related sulfurtransferase